MKLNSSRKISQFIIILIAMGALNSCSDPDDDSSIITGPPPARLMPIRITEIMVTNEDDLGYLEVEAHIYEVKPDTFVFLGCSGHGQGLGQVDTLNVLYKVNAQFVKPNSNGQFLTLEDVENKNVFIWVIEDDFRPCPAEFDLNSNDDFIGLSDPFPGSELATPRIMQFDDVLHLKIGI